MYANVSCAEIRNHIYHFATEADHFEGWKNPVPLVTSHAGHGCGQRQWPMSDYKCVHSARNFLGLTQTCKLIRKEYRPIWLRNSIIRVLPTHLSVYIHTFYGCGHGNTFSDLPKLIQLSHDKDDVGQEILDLTLLLRMHAKSPATQFEFIPDVLTQEEGPWTLYYDECDLCEDEMMDEIMDEMDEDEMDIYEMMDKDMGDREVRDCTHGLYHRAEYADYLFFDDYVHLGALNRFLAHDNVKWLEDIRNFEVARVKLDVSDAIQHPPEIIIRLSNNSEAVTQELSKKSLSAAALEYFNDRDFASTSTDEATLRFEIQICCGF